MLDEELSCLRMSCCCSAGSSRSCCCCCCSGETLAEEPVRNNPDVAGRTEREGFEASVTPSLLGTRDKPMEVMDSTRSKDGLIILFG